MSAMPDTTDTAVVAPPPVTAPSPPPYKQLARRVDVLVPLSPCRAATKHYRCGL